MADAKQHAKLLDTPLEPKLWCPHVEEHPKRNCFGCEFFKLLSQADKCKEKVATAQQDGEVKAAELWARRADDLTTFAKDIRGKVSELRTAEIAGGRGAWDEGAAKRTEQIHRRKYDELCEKPENRFTDVEYEPPESKYTIASTDLSEYADLPPLPTPADVAASFDSWLQYPEGLLHSLSWGNQAGWTPYKRLGGSELNIPIAPHFPVARQWHAIANPEVSQYPRRKGLEEMPKSEMEYRKKYGYPHEQVSEDDIKLLFDYKTHPAHLIALYNAETWSTDRSCAGLSKANPQGWRPLLIDFIAFLKQQERDYDGQDNFKKHLALVKSKHIEVNKKLKPVNAPSLIPSPPSHSSHPRDFLQSAEAPIGKGDDDYNKKV